MQTPGSTEADARFAIGCMLLGAFCISINDMLIKALSGDYPLHQIVFFRSLLALPFTFTFLQFEGGLRRLRTRTPLLHLTRGLLVVLANMLFYAAVVVMPLAEATALFFIAPLVITLLAIPLLGEPVGPRRLSAVAVGFLGVLVMMRPWEGFGTAGPEGVNRWFLLLPLGSAVAYAGMQILTRRLGVHAPAAAMAIYIQSTFLCVSILFGVIAGDGRFAEGVENESLRFLLRPWIIPEQGDLALIGGLGVAAGFIGYTLSQAYRSAPAATVAPFEYVLVPLSLFWGFAIFGELPGTAATIGSALITGAGLYVFMREGKRGRALATARPTRRP
ncbi:MAG: DMT family transporter [Pseudomonadota bacterium]